MKVISSHQEEYISRSQNEERPTNSKQEPQKTESPDKGYEESDRADLKKQNAFSDDKTAGTGSNTFSFPQLRRQDTFDAKDKTCTYLCSPEEWVKNQPELPAPEPYDDNKWTLSKDVFEKFLTVSKKEGPSSNEGPLSR